MLAILMFGKSAAAIETDSTIHIWEFRKSWPVAG
jgi:hypothetical protein